MTYDEHSFPSEEAYWDVNPGARTPRQTEHKPINYTPLWVIACVLFLVSGFGAGILFHHVKYTPHFFDNKGHELRYEVVDSIVHSSFKKN